MAKVTKPLTHTITLSSGETLTVKKRLNAGERRAMLRMMFGPDGTADGFISGQACVLAYLLDWTVKDDDTGEILQIRDPKTGNLMDKEFLIATLDSLDSEDCKEIEAAVSAHDDQMVAERKAEKKILTTKPPSGPISQSVPGSESPTPTSTS